MAETFERSLETRSLFEISDTEDQIKPPMGAKRESELVAEGFEAMAGLACEVQASVAKNDAMEPRIKKLEEQVEFVSILATNLEKIIVATAKKIDDDLKKNAVWMETRCEAQSRMMQQLKKSMGTRGSVTGSDQDLQDLLQKVDRLETQMGIMSSSMQHSLQKPTSQDLEITDKPSSLQSAPQLASFVSSAGTEASVARSSSVAHQMSAVSLASSEVTVCTNMAGTLGLGRSASSPPSSHSHSHFDSLLATPRLSYTKERFEEPKRACTQISRLPRLTSGEPWSGEADGVRILTTTETVSDHVESLKTLLLRPQPVASSTPQPLTPRNREETFRKSAPVSLGSAKTMVGSLIIPHPSPALSEKRLTATTVHGTTFPSTPRCVATAFATTSPALGERASTPRLTPRGQTITFKADNSPHRIPLHRWSLTAPVAKFR